jgi:hypothetical protein
LHQQIIDNKAFEFSPTYLRIQRQAPTNFSRLIGWSVVAFVTIITRRVPQTGTANPFGAPEFTPRFSGDRVAQDLV